MASYNYLRTEQVADSQPPTQHRRPCLAVLTEISGGDELGLSVHLVPERHLLVRDVPEPQLSVQRAAQEELIVPRVEGDGGDEVNVLEDAETLLIYNNQ